MTMVQVTGLELERSQQDHFLEICANPYTKFAQPNLEIGALISPQQAIYFPKLNERGTSATSRAFQKM